MSAPLITRKGNPFKPPRVMIYGVEGVGKSTFGAKADRPVFISPEGGVDRLRTSAGELVDEMPGITSWNLLRAAVKLVLNGQHDFKTLVLDSADWIEGLCHTHILGDSGKSIITVNKGYGSGYRESQTLHKELIEDLSLIREKRGMNIIVTAHAHVKDVKDPSISEDYQAFEIKCHEYVSSLWREWVDALFFVRFKTLVATSDDTVKARAVTDGTRVLYTEKQPSFQAKNRYGLPRELAFTENFWSSFIHHVRTTVPADKRVMSLEELCVALNDLWTLIPDQTTKDLVQKTIIEAGQDYAKLSQIHGRLVEMKNKREVA